MLQLATTYYASTFCIKMLNCLMHLISVVNLRNVYVINSGYNIKNVNRFVHPTM